MKLVLDNLMFFGGIAGTAVGIVVLFVLPGVFEKQRRKLIKKMMEE